MDFCIDWLERRERKRETVNVGVLWEALVGLYMLVLRVSEYPNVRVRLSLTGKTGASHQPGCLAATQQIMGISQCSSDTTSLTTNMKFLSLYEVINLINTPQPPPPPNHPRTHFPVIVFNILGPG